MHDTSLTSGEAFSETYGGHNKLVIDIGGKDVNGSLRSFFEKKGMTFISVDLEPHSSVNIVVKPGEKLPFEDGSVDLIVSTSCFEHDPCFWLTFKEMTRIIKSDGFIYVNAPTSGAYHCYPGDNWRFYSDAGQSLAYWSGIQISNENIYPVKVVETFNILGSQFNDFVCVWKRVDIENKETNIITSHNIVNNRGILEKTINNKGFITRKTC
uniref:Methyltransferase domain protein n=1 Tax=Pithovirus LCPAC104 TaxID=2506589 RepID=A0A481Z744_9VIRU|nr:MAG: methyltransferase domain protein [Pithovirus LCPAC104]